MLSLQSKTKAFDGTVEYYKHESKVNQCEMGFAVFLPPQARSKKVPALYWLSGLTCTEDNFTVKAGAQRWAAENGIALIAPDTSPRGDKVAKGDSYDLGLGAGFYLNATQEPWASHYQMYDYVVKELPQIVQANFAIVPERKSISGHSMGGHGALVIGLREPSCYTSVSAFAPIVAPSQVPWGTKAFAHYLGNEKSSWEAYDASFLVKKSPRTDTVLIDQGLDDKFLKEQLKPELFESACKEAGQKLELRRQPGYDHSYFFISTFIKDHIEFHAKRLNGF